MTRAKSKKKTSLIVVGLLQILLGLVVVYQSGFVEGGVFSPASNTLFSGSGGSADLVPTSATISQIQSQTFTVGSVSSASGIIGWIRFQWSVDGNIVADTTSWTGQGNQLTVQGSQLSVGTHQIQVVVFISGYGSVTCPASLTVTQAPYTPPTPTATPTPTPTLAPTPYNPAPTPTPAPITGALVISIDNSQTAYSSGPVSKTVFISGGGSPYVIHVYLNGGDTGAIITSNSQISASIPAYMNGQYVMYATVTDGYGRQSSSPTYQFTFGGGSQQQGTTLPFGSFSVTVDTSKTAYSILETPISETVYIQGGTAPYTVQVFLSLAEVSTVSTSNSKVSVNLPIVAAGQYTFYVRVMDSLGNVAESSDCTLTVSANASPNASPNATSYIWNPQNPTGTSKSNSMPFSFNSTTLVIFGFGVALLCSGFLTATYAFSLRKK